MDHGHMDHGDMGGGHGGHGGMDMGDGPKCNMNVRLLSLQRSRRAITIRNLRPHAVTPCYLSFRHRASTRSQ